MNIVLPVSQPFYLHNGTPYNWKDGLYIETDLVAAKGPLLLPWINFDPSMD